MPTLPFAGASPSPAFAVRPGSLTVVNLYGAPGVGKSAMAAGLFFLMKAYHLSVELVSEYAKYLVHTDRLRALEEAQLDLLSQQHHKQQILRGKYQYAVTDSPLLLCAFYAQRTRTAYPSSFYQLVRDYAGAYASVNFFLTRDVLAAHYDDEGRVHTRRDSASLEEPMRAFLVAEGVSFIEFPVALDTPWRMLDALAPGMAPVPDFEGRASA